jgi:hypothetical protein
LHERRLNLYFNDAGALVRVEALEDVGVEKVLTEATQSD